MPARPVTTQTAVVLDIGLAARYVARLREEANEYRQSKMPSEAHHASYAEGAADMLQWLAGGSAGSRIYSILLDVPDPTVDWDLDANRPTAPEA